MLGLTSVSLTFMSVSFYISTPTKQNMMTKDTSSDQTTVKRIESLRSIKTPDRIGDAYFEMLFGMSEDPILIYSVKSSSFIDANLPAQRIIGLAGKDELAELNVQDFSPEHQENGILSVEAWEQMINTSIEKKHHRFEWIHASSNDKLTHIEITNTLVSRGDESYLLSQWRDMTPYKKAIADLSDSKLKAVESDRLKTIFLANMSHELRTPLNSVIGFSNLILESDIEQENRYYASIIKDNGKQLLSVIEDLFDISMIEDGRMIVNKQKFDLDQDFFSSITLSVNEDISRLNKEYLRLHFVPDPKFLVLPICTDRFRLMQVFLNIMRNSVKFTHSGSIIFGYKYLGDRVRFFVEDTGIGIPQDKLDCIVKPFRQVSEQYTMNNGGIGLGLSICDKMIEHLDGEMKIQSVEGEGTIVEFWLPLEEAKINKAEKKEKLKGGICLKGKKILVAEDKRDNYLLLKTYLLKNGAECIRAKDGIEAVRMYNENPGVDLILMDIKMPRLDGYSAFRQIRKINSKVKIIATTAFAMNSDRVKINDHGFDAYVSKPIHLSALEKAICGLMN